MATRDRLNPHPNDVHLTASLKTVLLVAATLAAVTLVAVSARALFSHRKAIGGAPPTAVNPPAQGSPEGQRGGPVQVVRFTLYDAGIFPKEVRVNPGFVRVNLEDVSGNSAGLVLQKDAGPELGRVGRGQGQWRGSGRFRLEHGRYEIFDASQPTSRAVLVVEP